MNSEVYRLFVYGSLRSGLYNDVYTYISRYFELDGMGAVQGELYDIGEFPGAVPGTGSSYITGELYHIARRSDFPHAMEWLDEYEGLVVSAGETPLFRRELVHVLFQNTTVVAWMYLYNRSVAGHTRIGSGDYVAYKLGLGK